MSFCKTNFFPIIILFLSAFTSAKEVHFKQPVDIYASNEFDGARLSGLEMANNSTAIVVINPENVPINPSPYYAFKTWSGFPKSLYLTFKYPEGFKHIIISGYQV